MKKGIHPAFDGLLGYAYKRSDVPKSGNGKLITDIYPSTSPNRYRTDTLDSKAYEINTGWAKFGVKPTANAYSEISYSYQDAEHVLYPYLQMDAVYDDADRVNLAYQVENLTGFVRALRFHGYLTQVRHWMTDEYRLSSVGAARAYSMGTMATTRTFGGRFETSLPAVTVGLEAYRRGWNTTTLMAGSGYQTQYSIPDVNTDAVGMYADYTYEIGRQIPAF